MTSSESVISIYDNFCNDFDIYPHPWLFLSELELSSSLAMLVVEFLVVRRNCVITCTHTRLPALGLQSMPGASCQISTACSNCARGPPDPPTWFDGCNQKLSVRHALECKKGGLDLSGHNEIRNKLSDLAFQAFSMSALSDEPNPCLPQAGSEIRGRK
jgi:hypothetical protein